MQQIPSMNAVKIASKRLPMARHARIKRNQVIVYTKFFFELCEFIFCNFAPAALACFSDAILWVLITL
jgi:hypothetical protein